MKILSVGHFHGAGGAQRQLIMLSNMFAEKGNEVYLCVMADNKIPYELNKKISVVDITCAEKEAGLSIINRYIEYSNISKFPCIIKVSSGSGANLIVRDKDQYTEEYIQKLLKKYIIYSKIHARTTLEHQYIIDNPYIVVEELLNDGKGGIPNDYKFLYINGELSYIYCSVDRLGANVRQVYDENWNRLHFIWVEGADKKKFDRSEQSKSIPKPVNFELMKDLSGKLAKDYPLVRIDFYETGTQIYIGEITLHHGSGHDKFYPVSFDDYYGRMLNLPNPNRKN